MSWLFPPVMVCRSVINWLAVGVLAVSATFVGAAAVRADEIDEITTGDDFYQPHAEILRLYYAFFDRRPDPGGAHYWIARYNDGDSLGRIAEYMSRAPEFEAKFGSTADGPFITAIYANVLDREPDKEGLFFWTNGLTNGRWNRVEIVRHFAASSEFVNSHQFPGEEHAIPGNPPGRPITIGASGNIVDVAIDVEAGLPWSAEGVRAEVIRILADERSWAGEETVRFRFDPDEKPEVRVRIASPSTVDARCLPLRTGGRLSCRAGGSLHLNSDRWASATNFWTEPLAEYRAYLINHEMGHFLGHGHRNCPGEGSLAPVMQQQTKSLQGCLENGWPYPR